MSLKELSGLVDESEADTEQGMLILIAGYAQQDTALEIHESKGRCSLQLRAGLGELVRDLLPVNLSTATLRTLATIALKSGSCSPTWLTCAAPVLTTTLRSS